MSETSDFPIMREFYTPTVVADAVAELCRPLDDEGQGFARLVRAFTARRPSAQGAQP